MSISNENIKIVNTLWMISGTNCWVAIQQNQDYNFIKGVILNLNGNR